MSGPVFRSPYAPAPAADPYDSGQEYLERQKLQRAIPTPFAQTINANVTLTGQQDSGWVLVDASAGAVTVTLPLARNAPAMTVLVKKTDSSANAVTITRVGADTIDGATSVVVNAQWAAVVLRSDGGTAWALFVPSTAGSAASVGHSLTAGTHLAGGPYNGSAAVTLTTDATSANTASTIVARDASGNFSAGTISAALSGNASTASVASQLTAGNGTVNTEGNTKTWGVAQQSGLGAGFNIFTPASDYGQYAITVSGKDAATGLAPSNAFVDKITLNALAGTFSVATAWSTNTVGSPGSRTYTNATGALRVAVASGTTWYVDLFITKMDA